MESNEDDSKRKSESEIDDDEDAEEEEVPPPKEEQDKQQQQQQQQQEQHQQEQQDEEEDKTASCSPPAVLLNIPKVPQPQSSIKEEDNHNHNHEGKPLPSSSSSATAPAGEDSIGEFDDGRSGKLTLSILIQEGLIDPGEGVLTIDYLGQTFKGDLLAAGKIRSQETGLIFNNPSAWAIYCKKIVNPAKKSGCGWASVKYKGRKMDHFKTQWTKMKTKRDQEEAEKREESRTPEAAVTAQAMANEVHVGPVAFPQILRHAQLGLKPLPTTNVMPGGGFVNFPEPTPQPPAPDMDSPIEPETFVSQGRLQPFTLSVASSALLVVDIHAHTSKDAVVGYLAGHWDLNAHNLAITHAFPCLVDPECNSNNDGGEDDGPDEEEDKKNEVAARTEYDIYNAIYSRHLSLVGWYKTCPQLPRALPTIKDSESQLDFQVQYSDVIWHFSEPVFTNLALFEMVWHQNF